jgi:hypothetical protein
MICKGGRGGVCEVWSPPYRLEMCDLVVQVMCGAELTVGYLQRTGFTKPVIVARRDDLGLKVPPR